MNKQKLFISFSGGRTSGFMTKYLKDNVSDQYDIHVTFANTGQEHEETLKFVDRCDKEWGLNVVWLEAVVNPEHGKGTRHRVVTFETADREGRVFESVIQKYGIPNATFQPCNREMKTNTMDSYRRSVGWDKARDLIAIGIRADEIDRMNPRAKQLGLWYPLVGLGVTKEEVRAWWARQPFDLNLKEHQGNCVWCWKKSLRKHLTLINENPEFYDFPRRMEKLYPYAGAGDGPRVFFREHRSTEDLFELAKQPFEPFRENTEIQFPLFELDELDKPNGGCTESCEIYSDPWEDVE